MSGIRDTANPQMKSGPSPEVSRCIHAKLRGVGVGEEADQRVSAARGYSGIAQNLSASRILRIAVGRPPSHTRTCGTVRWVRFNPRRFVPLWCQFGPSPTHAPDSRLRRGQGLVLMRLSRRRSVRALMPTGCRSVWKTFSNAVPRTTFDAPPPAEAIVPTRAVPHSVRLSRALTTDAQPFLASARSDLRHYSQRYGYFDHHGPEPH